MKKMSYLVLTLALILMGDSFWSCSNGNASDNLLLTAFVSFKEEVPNQCFVKINVDYPVSGNKELVKNTQEFIIDALANKYTWKEKSENPEYKGNLTDCQSLVNFYGRNKVKELMELRKQEGMENDYQWEETIVISRDFENENCVSFRVDFSGCHGGVTGGLVYGATFSKKDGHRIKVFKNPDDKQLKKLIVEMIDHENLGDMYDKSELIKHPMPNFEPYIQENRITFIYQKYEIGAGALGVVEVSSYYASDYMNKMQPYLSDEVISLISDRPIEETQTNLGGEEEEKIAFIEGMYKDFYEPYSYDRWEPECLKKYFTSSAMKKIYVEDQYEEGTYRYATDCLIHGLIDMVGPDYGDKVVSRTITPQEDNWFLITNIWDVIDTPAMILLKVEKINDRYYISDIKMHESVIKEYSEIPN